MNLASFCVSIQNQGHQQRQSDTEQVESGLLVGLVEAPDGEGAVETGPYIGDDSLGGTLRELARHEALVGDQLPLHCGRRTDQYDRRHNGVEVTVVDRQVVLYHSGIASLNMYFVSANRRSTYERTTFRTVKTCSTARTYKTSSQH